MSGDVKNKRNDQCGSAFPFQGKQFPVGVECGTLKCNSNFKRKVHGIACKTTNDRSKPHAVPITNFQSLRWTWYILRFWSCGFQNRTPKNLRFSKPHARKFRSWNRKPKPHAKILRFCLRFRSLLEIRAANLLNVPLQTSKNGIKEFVRFFTPHNPNVKVCHAW